MKTVFLAATAVGATSVAISLYLARWKSDLSGRVTHSAQRGQVSSSSLVNIKTVPDEVFTTKYYSLYDYASKSVSRHLLPDVEPAQLLTLLIRRNMSTFASLPQAYLLRMLAATPESRRSFDAAYLRTLDFKEGDLVCNAYRVVSRSEERVEFEFLMDVKGRLVVSLEPRGDEVVIHNETLMWREQASRQVLPLERKAAQWMHELTAWWMVESGVQYLKDMKEKESTQ